MRELLIFALFMVAIITAIIIHKDSANGNN